MRFVNRDELKLKAVATAINEETMDLFTHLAPIGTAIISIDYDFVKENKNGSSYAGTIDVYSDGFISCEIFDPKSAPVIAEDYLKICLDDEKRPRGVFTHSNVLNPARWSRVKDFLKESGIELQYAEDIKFEREQEIRDLRGIDEDLEEKPDILGLRFGC